MESKSERILEEDQKTTCTESRPETAKTEPIALAQATTVPELQRQAQYYTEHGDYEKAIDAYEKIIYFPQNPLPPLALGQIRCDLAQACAQTEDYNKAVFYYESAIGTPGLPPEVLAKINCSLGEAHRKLEEFDKAIACFNRALVLSKSVLGDQHKYIAILHTFIALTRQDGDKLPEAVANFKLAIEIFGKQGEAGQEDIAHTYYMLSQCYGTYDAIKEAKECATHASELFSKLHGAKSLPVAECNLLGATLSRNSDDYKRALEYLEKAIDVWETLKFDDADKVGDAFVQQGYCQYKLERYNLALTAYRRALDVHRKAYLKEDEWTAMLYYGIGKAFYRKKEIGQAEEWLLKAYTVLEEFGQYEARVTKWLRRVQPKSDSNLKPSLEPDKRPDAVPAVSVAGVPAAAAVPAAEKVAVPVMDVVYKL